MPHRNLFALLALFAFFVFLPSCTHVQPTPLPAPPSTMTIESSTFPPNGLIPSKYTCDGDDVSPPLAFSDVPSDAKSLVLIMDDPDVPKYIRPSGIWDHWIVFNIPPTTSSIPEGQEPEGVHGKGTGGNLTYKGPCPPDREHRYFFKLYALDTMISLSEGSSKAEVEKAMKGHILASAELIARYERMK